MVNMWCAQTLMLTKRDADGGAHHYRVSKNRFARKYRNNFRYKRKAGNDQDINLWMSKNPEEVHPQTLRSLPPAYQRSARQDSDRRAA